MEAEGPKVWVEMIVSGEDLRAAISPERAGDLLDWAHKMAAASAHRKKLEERLIEPAWAALLDAVGSSSLGEPWSYRVKISVERDGN